ncbi:MAG TPA: hypothetical protein VK753_07955 [Xanthomonadaceae bacterium]|nr:hypothetical protein [Xanthomonadaceae bacterium]
MAPHLARTGVLGAFVCAMPCVAAIAPVQNPQDFRHDLAHRLQKSESPRDWAFGAQLLATQSASGADLHERNAILQKAAHAAPGDRMVQALWANASLSGHCTAKQACGDRSALARLEPDNGAAWLTVVDGAWRSGNARAIDAAIARMAASGRYNEHLGEAIAAWRDVFQRFPPPAQAGANATSVGGSVLNLAFDEAVSTAIPSTASLVDACSQAKHPEAGTKRFANCGRIARLMMGRAQTLSGRADGAALLRASHAGAKADIERVRTVTWQSEQFEKVASVLGSDPVAKQNYMNLIQASDSEMPAVQYDLTIFGIPLTPPADWKQTVDGKTVEPLDDVTVKAP